MENNIVTEKLKIRPNTNVIQRNQFKWYLFRQSGHQYKEKIELLVAMAKNNAK